MAYHGRLCIGSLVIVSGLVGRSDLNGCQGVVKTLVDPSSGRFSVIIKLSSGKKCIVLVRAVNISLTTDEKRKHITEHIANIPLFAEFKKVFETGSSWGDVDCISQMQEMRYYVVMNAVPQLQGLLDAAFRDPSAIQGVFEFIQTLLARYNRMTLMDQIFFRERFCKHIAWSFPNLEILQIMKSIAGDAIVGDFFAGNGLLAAMGSSLGVKMIALDLEQSPLPFCDILISDAIHAVSQYPGMNHFVMSWPPQDDPIGVKFLKAILSSREAESSPVTIFYFGTPRGGCCGTPELFDLLDTRFNVVASVCRPDTETWSEIMMGPDGPILDSFVVYRQK